MHSISRIIASVFFPLRRLPVFLQAFLVSRVIIWAFGALALQTIGKTKNYPTPILVPGDIFGVNADTFFATAARWDAQWFLGIADDGYSRLHSEAFFPLYPFMVRFFGFLLGSQPLAALLLVLTSFLLALWLLGDLVERQFGKRVATRTVWLLALFPASLFFSAFYSESLFLLFSVFAFTAGYRERWFLAGASAALAALTRNVGILLFFPLLVMYVAAVSDGTKGDLFFRWGVLQDGFRQQWRKLIRLKSLWLLLIPLGFVCYPLGLALSGKGWDAPYIAQQQWKRSWALPFETIWHAGGKFLDSGQLLLNGSAFDTHSFSLALADCENFLLLLALLALCFSTRFLLPKPYQLYCLLCLLVPLCTPSDYSPLMSFIRFAAVIFPLAMMFALWLEERPAWLYYASLFCFAVGLAGYATFFATWRWVA